MEAWMTRPPQILWIDCSAAAAAGMVMLLARTALSRWYQLPVTLIGLLGAVNLGYAGGSFMLARARRRPRWTLLTLVAANAGWAAVCLLLALTLHRQASWLGTTHLVVEAGFVATLAAIEWRQRRILAP
jgi:hypothetical protein